MNEKRKNVAVVCVAAVFVFGFFIWSVCKPADEFSDSERRRLAQFPEARMGSILSGKFMKDFETYATEQFPMRDEFRTVDAFNRFYVLRQKDNQGIYLNQGYIGKLEFPLDENSLDKAAERFRYLYETYFAGKDMNLYFSIIPDKNYFMAEKNGYPVMDYEQLFSLMQEKTEYMQYIDITDLLDITDYYKTDTHWRQEKILDVAERIGTEMGVTLSGEYSKRFFDKPFYGVYYGQAALPLPAEELHYLDSDILKNCVVYDHENNKKIPIYDMEKGHGRDPYELFLSGPLSLVTIENPNGPAGRELIVFRDSFGSSLAPLLVAGYKKITLVDIRYLPGERLGSMLAFDDQDVLFLYSTSVLNNSETLR